MNRLNLNLGVAVLVAFVSSVAALQCYSCSPCNDPFDKSSAKTTSCSGSCVKTAFEGAVSRICSPISGGDDCEEANGAEVCSCTSDLCNSASSHVISYVILITLLTVIFLWKNWPQNSVWKRIKDYIVDKVVRLICTQSFHANNMVFFLVILSENLLWYVIPMSWLLFYFSVLTLFTSMYLFWQLISMSAWWHVIGKKSHPNRLSCNCHTYHN